MPRALSKSLARVGISKPVAHSRNASATGGLPTVLLPWNLGSYEPMNNFIRCFGNGYKPKLAFVCPAAMGKRAVPIAKISRRL